MTETEFHYPTTQGLLRSPEEYARRYLPAMHDRQQISPRFRTCLDLAKRHGEPSGAWLDYGCGGGVFVWHLAQQMPGWTIDGYDGDYSSIEIAKHSFSGPGVSYRLAPYDAIDNLPTAQYDGISFLEVIEHVDNPGVVIGRLARALKPGGLLLVSTPDFLGLLSLHDEIRRRINRLIGRRSNREYVQLLKGRPYDPTTNDGHVAVYSLQTLTTLLRTKGLDLVDFEIAPRDDSIIARVFPDTLVVLARKGSTVSGGGA